MTEKVAFNIASIASYVYIFSVQKFIKNAKNDQFWRLIEYVPETCSQTVLPDRLISIGQKLVENAKIKNFKCHILSNFQTCLVLRSLSLDGAVWLWKLLREALWPKYF